MTEWAVNGSTLVLRRGGDVIVPTAEEIYSSIIEGQSAWPDLAAGQSGDAKKLKFSRYPPEIKVILEDQTDGEMPLAKLEAHPRSGAFFQIYSETLEIGHVIEAGTWYPLSTSNLSEVSDILHMGGVNENGKLGSIRGLLALKKAAANGGLVNDRTHLSHHKIPSSGQTGKSSPKGIIGQLYPYQEDGWRWLSFIVRERLGALLADEMGLGKTLQVISALRDPGTGKKVTSTLVVAPGSILENWKREIEKFCPDLRVLKHQGSMRTGRPIEIESYDVVLTSYDIVVRDLSLLKMIDWTVVVLDEAQNIKNPKAKRTVSAKQLSRSASLAITGTPVENRLTDLWSIMDFALPGYLGSIKEFQDNYEDDVDAAKRIEPLISPLLLRRRISEVANELPERIDIPEIIELNEEEAETYDKIRIGILNEYGKSASLVALTKLRQFCAHPNLIPDHVSGGLSDEFAKFARLFEILEEIMLCGEKVNIFTSYTKMADSIAAKVGEQFGVFAEVFDSRTSIDDRQPLIDRFTEVIGPGVLVLNPKAGGAGLNITAATNVIHYNLEWNPALEDQASARAYRRGQTRPVTVRRLICGGTVEEVVEDRVQRKRQLSDAAVVGVSGSDDEQADLMAALTRSPITGWAA